MVNAAIADAVVFDPEMDNISAFLQENQWADNVVTEYMLFQKIIVSLHKRPDAIHPNKKLKFEIF